MLFSNVCRFLLNPKENYTSTSNSNQPFKVSYSSRVSNRLPLDKGLFNRFFVALLSTADLKFYLIIDCSLFANRNGNSGKCHCVCMRRQLRVYPTHADNAKFSQIGKVSNLGVVMDINLSNSRFLAKCSYDVFCC